MAKSIKQMEREINELANVDTFYEDVRHIVGYYEGRFIEDWNIKRLQRVADKRYTEIGGVIMTTRYEAHGQWIESKPYSKEGRWDINYSDMLSQLIQSCGRYCQRYASDLFIDWKYIEKELEKGEPINDTYIFAIRTDGVDHKSFYEARKDSQCYRDTFYHEVWELKISTDGRWMEMELNLIAN